MLKSLPSNIGELMGSNADLPQFQYWEVSGGSVPDKAYSYGLASLVAAFISEGLLIIPCEKTMPREKIGLSSSQHIIYSRKQF